jgi:hypothetical protein
MMIGMLRLWQAGTGGCRFLERVVRFACATEARLSARFLCDELDCGGRIAAGKIPSGLTELCGVLVAAGEDGLPGPYFQTPCDDLTIAGIDYRVRVARADAMRGDGASGSAACEQRAPAARRRTLSSVRESVPWTVSSDRR